MSATLPGGKDYPTSACVIDGVRWEIDTNGHAMVLRAVDETGAPEAPWGHTTVAADPARMPWAHAPVRTDVPSLEAFLGAAEQETTSPCPECDGSGTVDHACDCQLCDVDFAPCVECDDTHTVRSVPDARPVRIHDVFVNANLMAAALLLAHARGECGVARVAPNSITVGGKGWRVHVMAIRVNETEAAEAPTFLSEVSP